MLDFTHNVMGPTTGMLMGDLGAEVIHIEPPAGDATRRLRGFGSGYFAFYSRNKKSLAVDLKADAGAGRSSWIWSRNADVVVENFGPGTMDRLGYGYDALKEITPDIIYCSMKGFLSGPYEQRAAMDEVVQMMSGLAYMTGEPGKPMRAGTSIIDMGGGMFGLIGILTALYNREQTGEGIFLKTALFETAAYFMGQHMAYGALTDEPVPPMPARVSAWSIYRVFECRRRPDLHRHHQREALAGLLQGLRARRLARRPAPGQQQRPDQRARVAPPRGGRDDRRVSRAPR